jgi:Wax ester synthase-like Acyl-CoA acyltransferase domain
MPITLGHSRWLPSARAYPPIWRAASGICSGLSGRQIRAFGAPVSSGRPLFWQVLGTPTRIAAREPLRLPCCSHPRAWALRLVAAVAIMCLVGLEPGGEYDLIERASAIDLMELASDFGPVPLQVGAILVSGPGESLAAGEVRDALADRICAIARLRQQLVPAPPGCGRPVWVDDPEFDVARHVHEVACSPPGDEGALLRAAAGVVTVPLPPGQPLWSATIVTGLAGDACAVIVVFHHVLADGMGGLAVLASLVDGAVNAPRQDFPRAKP